MDKVSISCENHLLYCGLVSSLRNRLFFQNNNEYHDHKSSANHNNVKIRQSSCMTARGVSWPGGTPILAEGRYPILAGGGVSLS